MTDFALRFDLPAQISASEAAESFYWPPSGRGSFATSLDPNFGSLGPVEQLNVDFGRIAVAVYAADRSVLRTVGSVNWTSRNIGLRIPVSDPAAWNEVRERLASILRFLSGDNWTLVFEHGAVDSNPAVGIDHSNVGRVVLLSGGADSATGALMASLDEVEHLIISHYGGNGIGKGQREVVKNLRELLPGASIGHHLQIGFKRRRVQPNGLRFKDEPSTRTRSLLFLALGLAVASVHRVPLWIPENGFASLNPAMGADQLGSVSTKTTHPWLLSELGATLSSVGAHGLIENPFMSQTKGEMFSWVSEQIGPNGASTYLSRTDSCGYTNRRFLGISRDRHCGTCFGCLMRRSSFAASGVEDRSRYAIDNPPSSHAADVLRNASLLPSIRGFAARGVRVSDIAAMRLPAGYSPNAARDLCIRGLAELAML